VERGEAAALHPEQQPEQHAPPPRGQHLHGRVALRYGRLDVRHGARPRRGATLAAAAVVVDVVGRGGGGGVLREREESGETLGAVAGGGVVAFLSLQ
jgi:hypothetical protein